MSTNRGNPNNSHAVIATVRSIAAQVVIGVSMISLVGLLAPSAWAADVRVGLSSQEAYVGLPVVLQIRIDNASDYQRPEIPEVEGLEIVAVNTPSRSSQVTIINGRRTERSSITFAYQVTPDREGSFTIGPIAVMTDGQSRQTDPIQLVASASETGDLLFVEVEGKQDQIYVGQALELTLRIWIKPYRNRQHAITLSESTMWRTVSNATHWGSFTESIQELANNHQRPGGREVLRTDGEGVERSYYQFEIDTTVYPQRPGPIDADDVRIVVQYPTALEKSRSPFSNFFGDDPSPFSRSRSFDDDFASPFRSRLQVRSVRPIVGEATVEPIMVKPIPTAGRPADYRGAVGQYKIVTDATPTHVKAGDPISLDIVIEGTGPMDLVQAPPLAELAELTAEFKVPSEPLAGFVSGNRKGFSTTLRPRREGITQIPAIPLSYFDPDAGQFVTVRSEPIAIEVDPADMLALDAIVGRDHGTRGRGASGPDESSTGLVPVLENDGDEARLLSRPDRPTMAPWPLWALLAAPPLLVVAVQLTRAFPHLKGMLRRFSSPASECKRRVDNAKDPVEVSVALHEMLARRGGGSDPSVDSVGRLRTAGYRDLAIRFQRIFDQCDRSSPDSSTDALEQLKAAASQAVSAWQSRRRSPREIVTTRQHPRRRGHAVASSLGTSSSRRGSLPSHVLLILVAMTLTAIALVTAPGFGKSPRREETPTSGETLDRYRLTGGQQSAILAEANRWYQDATEAAGHDDAEAKQAFSQSADRYQLIVDSGVHNGRLYGNLANAQLQSGQIGLAIANYQRALRWEPTNRSFRNNLHYARQLAQSPNPGPAGRWTSSGQSIGETLWNHLASGNEQLNRYVAPQSVLRLLVVSWWLLWGVIGWRLFRKEFAWRTIAAVASLVCAVCAMSLAISTTADSPHDVAVILKSAVELREGDGGHFPVVNSVDGTLGQTVKILNQRDRWVHVQMPTGLSGWLSRSVVEPI